MTIDPTSAAGGASNIDAMNLSGADGYSLSPESILQWLNRRLGNRDEMVRSLISEVETQDLAYKNLSKKIQALQTIRSAMMNAGKEGNDQMRLGEVHVTWNGEDMTAAELLNEVGIADLTTSSGPRRAPSSRYYFTSDSGVESEIHPYLEGETFYVRNSIGRATPVPRDRLRIESTPAQYTNDMSIRLDAITTFKEQKATQQQTVNTGRDMLTTRLQSEIQARSQDITLGTQMMRNVNESRAAILRNIR